MRERLEDPSFPPSHAFVERVFMDVPGPNGELMKDTLAFHRFCERSREDKNGKRIYVHEILTQEFLLALANHFSNVIEDALNEDPTKPFVLLEVGAGDGRLSGFLRRILKARFGDHVFVVATDIKSKGATPEFRVENMDYETALDTFRPDAVLVSWMPRQDWTKEFRNPARNIREYVLIGEPDAGVSGTEDTWDEGLLDSEGFDAVTLDEATDRQISHTDHGLNRMKDGEAYFSRTIVFKRDA